MSQQIRHEVPDYLESKLRLIGRRSLEALCESMCTRNVSGANHNAACYELAHWFEFLAMSEVELRERRTLRIRPLDSYKSALGGITLRDLKGAESGIKALIHTINKLKRAPLVRELAQRGLIPPGDALQKVDFPFDGSQFETLLNLRNLAKQVLGDPRKARKPDFDSDLAQIYRCIHEHSGKWHDERVADILNDLFRNRAEPFTQYSLKQWRYNHGLSGIG
jgi:hypothetical protein